MSDDKKSVAKRAKSVSRSPLPLSVQELRNQIIAASGVTVETLAEQFNQALKVINEAMQAEKQTIVSFQGKVETIITEADHATRLKASAQLMALVGMDAKQATTNVNVGDTFIIQGELMDMMKEARQTIDIKPQQEGDDNE